MKVKKVTKPKISKKCKDALETMMKDSLGILKDVLGIVEPYFYWMDDNGEYISSFQACFHGQPLSDIEWRIGGGDDIPYYLKISIMEPNGRNLTALRTFESLTAEGTIPLMDEIDQWVLQWLSLSESSDGKLSLVPPGVKDTLPF